jgi:hypothetical protein
LVRSLPSEGDGMIRSELAGLQMIARDAYGEEILCPTQLPRPSPSILIADDNENVRRVLVEYVRLIMESDVVLEAANSIEALRIVKDQRPKVCCLTSRCRASAPTRRFVRCARSIPTSASSSLQAMAAIFEANARFLRTPGRDA